MISLDVKFEVDRRQQQALEWLLREFPKKADKAIARAIDRAGAKTKTLTLRAITKAITIRRKDLTMRHAFGLNRGRKPAVVLEKHGKGRNREAEVRISGRRIPIVWFKAKPVFATPRGKVSTKQIHWKKGWFSVRRPAGVRWQISRGGAKKHEPLAFFARGRRGKGIGKASSVAQLGTSGHVGVFRRWPRSIRRLPIAQLHGPSIAQEAQNNAALEKALSATGEIRETLTKRLEHELSRLIKAAK